MDAADRAIIELVQAGSPAEQAGLQVNDQVVSISGVFIDDTQNTFSTLMSHYSGGDQVELGVIRYGESDLTHINVTLSSLLPPVIITPSAEITVNKNTELVVDIGFNGVTGILVLADWAQVREPVTESQVNVPAGSAVIVVPGYDIGNPIKVGGDQITRWWEGKKPSTTAPYVAPIINPVVSNDWMIGLGALGICGAGFLLVGLLVVFSRRKSAAVAQQMPRTKPAPPEKLFAANPPPPETLNPKKGSQKPPPPEKLT